MSQQSFDLISLKDLKTICKFKKYKGYSKLKKNEIVDKLVRNYSAIRIQRFLRGVWNDEVCPISLEPVCYPCFSFKPKGFIGKVSFIYYNLEPLINYLLSSGDFRDPKTREPYSEKVLKQIDQLAKTNNLKYKSVYKASNNGTIYRRNREREEDIIVIERCIDEIVHSMRIIMETETMNDSTITLSSFHFPTFHRYFRNLLYKSEEASRRLLVSTINVITGPDQRPSPDPNNLKDFILQFLYTLETTYFVP